MPAKKEFLELGTDEDQPSGWAYKIAAIVLGCCTVILFVVVCVLSALLAQKSDAGAKSPASAGTLPAKTTTIPERLYYCNDAQKTGGACTQLPLGTTTQSHGQVAQPLSLGECNLVCGGRGQCASGGDKLASLWPLPTSRSSLLATTIVRKVCPRKDWTFQFSGAGASGESGQMLQDATGVLLDTLESQYGAAACPNGVDDGFGSIKINIQVQTSEAQLRLHTDESYTLTVDLSKSPPAITVTAPTFFGARNGLETLSQLVARAPVDGSTTPGLSMVQRAVVEDAPAYTYRGLMLDTSRHFLPITTLQSAIEGMAASKLNTLHLHLTDTASVPIELPTQPNITKYGAYGPDLTYSVHEMQNLIEFARVRGVRVIPEIDAPAHVRSGWTPDWTKDAGLGALVVCLDNWASSALEAPGGQLDPTNPNTMTLLKDVYTDIVAAFQQPPVFHMGGDEVIVGCEDPTKCFASCWNSTKKAPHLLAHLKKLGLSREDPESFYQIWKNFTTEAYTSLLGAYGTASPQKVMQWGGTASAPSAITYNLMGQSDIKQILPPNKFIIEVWDNLQGSIAPELMDKGYDVVLANTDYVYLDCGQPGWAQPGGYWCQPYHEWFRVYEYLPDALKEWNTTVASRKHILGSEVLMWGEEVDQHNLEPKVWPRAAALAERFWSDPATGWYEASPRMQQHRQRLVERGIQAAGLQPQWCLGQEAHACTLHKGDKESNIVSVYKAPGVPHAQQVVAAQALYQSDTHGAL